MEIKRQIAKKVTVADITNGTYIKRSGWEPNVVITKKGEVSRVHLVGVVVSNIENNAFMFDDGSANIMVRNFEQEITNIKIGDLIRLIGRVREYEDTKYVLSEIIKKIENKAWLEVHKNELSKIKEKEIILPVETATENEENFQAGPYQKIINTIAMLDSGNGADVTEIIENIKIKDAEKIIQNLIMEGEIFELSPGKVKLLE